MRFRNVVNGDFEISIFGNSPFPRRLASVTTCSGQVERSGRPGLVPVIFEILILLVEIRILKMEKNFKIRAKLCIKMTQTTVFSL